MLFTLLSTASAVLVLDLVPEMLGNNTSHYGNPSGGCMSDEQSVQVQGVTGDFCSPACTGLFKRNCPSDVPSGVTATPACILQDSSSGNKYCALECQTGGANTCGSGASCKKVQMSIGICTYDS